MFMLFRTISERLWLEEISTSATTLLKAGSTKAGCSGLCPVGQRYSKLLPGFLFLEQTYCLLSGKQLKYQVSCTCIYSTFLQMLLCYLSPC